MLNRSDFVFHLPRTYTPDRWSETPSTRLIVPHPLDMALGYYYFAILY